MNLRSRLTQASGFVLVCLLSLCSGCTRTIEVTPRPVEFRSASPIQLSVELLLTNQFRTAQWVFDRRGGGTWQLPLGPSLADNAVRMGKSAFSRVAVTEGEKPKVDGGVEAVLIPKVVTISRDSFRTHDQQTTAVRIEWTLNDRTGKLIWVDTVLGVGKGPQDLFVKDGVRQQVQAALDAVFKQSRDSIISSVEVKGFVDGLRKSGS